VNPAEQAAELRRRARFASGADKLYLEWLAHEWELTAGRDKARRLTPAPACTQAYHHVH